MKKKPIIRSYDWLLIIPVISVILLVLSPPIQAIGILLLGIIVLLPIMFWIAMIVVALDKEKNLWAAITFFIPISALYFYFAKYRNER